MGSYAEQLCDEVNRRYPLMAEFLGARSAEAAVGHRVLTPPEPCESCGETVVVVEPEDAHRAWYEIGHLHGSADDPKVRLLPHTPARCARHRAAGPRGPRRGWTREQHREARKPFRGQFS
jgi:hypothetical protein